MHCKNFKSIMILISLIGLIAFSNSLTADNVEWSVYQTLQVGAKPIDVALTPDGRRIFVLTGEGEILVYSSSTKVEAKIDVGKHVDRIKSGPRGETLILSSGEKETVQIITIDFIHKINTTGDPFRGPENAPVVIATFDDYQ